MSNELARFDRLPVKKGFRNKAIAWIKRFLPAEATGSLMAVVASYMALRLTQNKVLAAYAGAIGETTGFYLTLLIQASLSMRRTLQQHNQRFTAMHVLKVLGHMLIEFGPAEILDSLFVRPFFMYLFPILMNNYALGIMAGKIASDVAFYVPVIALHEVRRWWVMKRERVEE